MQSVEYQIKEWIIKKWRGKIFFIDDFAAFGTPDAIKKIVTAFGAVRPPSQLAVLPTNNHPSVSFRNS
ncbi:MAG: hypothetical protein LBV75_05310 [Paludibacter sp.]|jgi:hypothetical protein|nr:hypothetical protein [Paludibacter sp.]